MIAALVRVGDISDQIRGVSYGKSDAITQQDEGYLPVLRAGNITDSGLMFDDLVFVPAARISQKQKIRKGDVVIAASSGSLDVVGKAALAQSDYEGGFGAFCKVLRPNPAKVEPAYFANYFQTREYRQKVSSLAAGANINNLKNEHLDDLMIPLPSLPEQRRIAAILDQADALRAKRREALAQLDSLTQSIFIEMFGDPVVNPKGWPIVPFDSFYSDETSACEKIGTSGYQSKGMFPIVDQGQKLVAGFCDDEGLLAPIELPVTVFGDHTRIIKHVDFPFVVGADGAKVLKAKQGINPNFASHLLQLLPIPNLGYSRHMKEVKRLIYPVPSKLLQDIFESRIKEIQKAKQAHLESLNQISALFSSLQHRAFRGEL